MELQALLSDKIIWTAAQNEHDCARPFFIDPTSILRHGFSHEFYFSATAKTDRCTHYPILALLPFVDALHTKQEPKNSSANLVVFLGRELWPTPFCLRDSFNHKITLENIIFIDSCSQKHRHRALETLVRSSQVRVVISFLKGVSFAFTQKLHLLAKQSNVSILLFREIHEIQQKSAAFSRWEINPVVSLTDFPSWHMTLRHSKGLCLGEKKWLIEGINEEAVSVHLLPELVSRSDSEDVPSSRYA